MRTIEKIITKVDTSRGATMGRRNVGEYPGPYVKTYDCYVPMDGVYDKGGAYWGLGSSLRVRYTKCLTYIEFYRYGEGPKVKILTTVGNSDAVFCLLDNGDIRIYLNPDQDTIKADDQDECVLCDLLDNARLLGNGWNLYDPADGGHLTEAPMITDGDNLWYWNQYMVYGIAETLLTRGFVTLTKA